MNFYLIKDDQKLGPYSAEQIQTFLQQKLVSSSDLCWADGWSSWMQVGNVPGLAIARAGISTPTQALVPPTTYSQSSTQYAENKNPLVACVLSLAVVGTGQMYNGDWGKGWAVLGICIVTSVFSWEHYGLYGRFYLQSMPIWWQIKKGP
jgi:TM2 domain-containing membrane protein YozV